MTRRWKIALIIIGSIFAFGLILIGWAYMDVIRHRDLVVNDVDLQNIGDGVYEGSLKAGRFSNSVAVTVRDHRIVDIKSTKSASQTDKLRREIFDRVMAEQSLRMDAVSGASVTTLTTLKAIENALTE